MADLPDPGGNSSGWWMGLGAIIAGAAAALGGLWERFSKTRRDAKEQQAKLDAEAAARKQSEETDSHKRKHEDESTAISQWREFAQRQDEEIKRLNALNDAKETQIAAQQVSLNTVYRQCSAQEIDITEQYAAITFFHQLAVRLAGRLQDGKLPCEEVPAPPPRPIRRGDPEGPEYQVRVARQNAMFREAAKKKLAEGSGK